MSLIGRYVETFAEATHALPQGMHMNADYPFMLPKITAKDGKSITIVGRRGETATVPIRRDARGEYSAIAQCSSFEVIYNRKPKRFRLLPFREENKP